MLRRNMWPALNFLLDPQAKAIWFVDFVEGYQFSDLRASGLKTIRVNLKGCQTKDDVVLKILKAFDCPEIYATNWDAFIDHMTDLSWIERGHFVLILENMEPVAKESPRIPVTLMEVWTATSEHWAARDIAANMICFWGEMEFSKEPKPRDIPKAYLNF